jgi:hypothetical protein
VAEVSGKARFYNIILLLTYITIMPPVKQTVTSFSTLGLEKIGL